MADRVLRVVRVEDIERVFPVTTELEDGQLWAVLGDLANEVLVGDVIELTEERFRPFIDDGESMGQGKQSRRLVTEWEGV